ncbi:MAG TPA: DUF2309 domain-containing protein [Fluviicola sp.]|nr:DUF2309 domain-containing protein [Fluviicola sp.]
MENQKASFQEDLVLEHISHYLPEQAPLKDFIHHNTLHAFQQHTFHQGLAEASTIFGYKVYMEMDEYRAAYHAGKIDKANLERVLKERIPEDDRAFYKTLLLNAPIETNESKRIGEVREYWKSAFKMDLDSRVHPMLFRIIGSYIDQGIATWNFPVHEAGFLASFRLLEKNSYASFFQSKRVKAMLLDETLTLTSLLKILVGDERLYEQYLFDQQFAHPGWSGMVSVIEHNPEKLLNPVDLSLKDMIILECLLEIDAIDDVYGEKWEPLARFIDREPQPLFAPVVAGMQNRLLQLWHEAFEWTYYDQVLRAVKEHRTAERVENPSFQALLCIDDRECSLRRYMEQEDERCETFATPGHFNLEFYFQPEDGRFVTKVCPAPATAKVLIKEFQSSARPKKDLHFSKRNHGFLGGFVMTAAAGWVSAVRLATNIVSPRLSPLTSASAKHMDPTSILAIEGDGAAFENGLQLGFTLDQMADRLQALLTSIGLVENFAPLVYAIGHGSTSVNNTHFAGYDCGACSGRPGSVNARVISFIGNHAKVREMLRKRGIDIPDGTRFIGGLHDTSRDEFTFFDVDQLPVLHQEIHGKNNVMFEKVLDLNAQERSRRFESIETKAPVDRVHRKVKRRTVSLFEPRPELNHATNALCVVGRRVFTKGLFLDRRAFMNSFDYRVDPTGKFLEGILNAVAPVAGGINLEYYFSRVDNQQLGAGSKLPHNVVGLIGVANGIDGDLRTGLPYQMIEVHDPVRLLVIVEHFPEVVLDTIKRNPATFNWFSNEWIRLVAAHPETGELHLFKTDRFEVYEPLPAPVPEIEDYLLQLHSTIDNVAPALLKKASKWSM